MLVWWLVLVLRSKVKYIESYRGRIQEYPKKKFWSELPTRAKGN